MTVATLAAMLVALIILGALIYIVGLLPIDATIKQIIRVVAIVVTVIWLISKVTGFRFG